MEEKINPKENCFFDKEKIKSGDWRKTLLDNEIMHTPDNISQKDYDYLKKKNECYISESIYFLKKKNFFIDIIWGSILLLLGVSFLVYSILNYDKFYWESLILPFLFGTPGIIYILIAITKKRTGLILHRAKGIISYPNGYGYSCFGSTFIFL